MKQLIIIEGSRNVGKSFLLNQLQCINKYKYPFADYFNESFIYDFEDSTIECNKKSELHYYTLSTDTTILDLFKSNLIMNDLIIDRGFISSLVFGIQSNRITYKQALNQGKYIINKYKDIYKIILIVAEEKLDNRDRDKDIWIIYNQIETNNLYKKILKDLDIDYIEFKNEFNIESVEKFNKLF